jgi:hypothetical protein
MLTTQHTFSLHQSSDLLTILLPRVKLSDRPYVKFNLK